MIIFNLLSDFLFLNLWILRLSYDLPIILRKTKKNKNNISVILVYLDDFELRSNNWYNSRLLDSNLNKC